MSAGHSYIEGVGITREVAFVIPGNVSGRRIKPDRSGRFLVRLAAGPYTYFDGPARYSINVPGDGATRDIWEVVTGVQKSRRT